MLALIAVASLPALAFAQNGTVEFRFRETTGQTQIVGAADAVLDLVVEARVVGVTGRGLGDFNFDIRIDGEAESNGTLQRASSPNALAAPYRYLAGLSAAFNGSVNTSSGTFVNGPDQEIGLITGSARGGSLIAGGLVVDDGFGTLTPATEPDFTNSLNANYGANGNWSRLYTFRYTATNLTLARSLVFTLVNPTASTFANLVPAGTDFAANTTGGNAQVSAATLVVPVGCTISLPPPMVGGDVSICPGGSTNLMGTVASGETIDWFATACGTGTLVGTGMAVSVSPTATTTYFARTRNTTTGCVSTCTPLTVQVESVPAAPTPGSSPSICAGESTMISATPPANSTIEWFTGSCGGTFVGTGTSITVSPAVTTTYFARSRAESSGCLGTDCGQVTVTVDPRPTAPTVGGGATINLGQEVVLTATAGPNETVDWFQGACGGRLIGTGLSLSVSPTAATTYFARARNTVTGCIGTQCSAVPINVNFNAANGLSQFRIREMTGQSQVSSSADAQLDMVVEARVSGVPGRGIGDYSFVVFMPGEAESRGNLARLRISEGDGSTYVGVPTASTSGSELAGIPWSHRYLADINSAFNGVFNQNSGVFINTPDQEIGLVTGSARGGRLSATGIIIEDGLGGFTPATGAALAAAKTAWFGADDNWVPLYRFRYTATDLAPRQLRFELQDLRSSTFTGLISTGTQFACDTTLGFAETTHESLTIPVCDIQTPVAGPSGGICIGETFTLTALPGPGEVIEWFAGGCGGTPVGVGTNLVVTPATTTIYYARARQPASGCISENCAVVEVTVSQAAGAQTFAAPSPQTGARFGWAVDIDGSNAIIGSRSATTPAGAGAGQAFAYTLSGLTWNGPQVLTPSDAAAGDDFGNFAAVHGQWAVIGARFADAGGITDSGAAYVFSRTGAGWAQAAKLTAPDATSGAQFAHGVAVFGDRIAVGAFQGNAPGQPTAGAVYVFRWDGTAWAFEAKLVASDAQSGQGFGIFVSMNDDTIIVCAPYDDQAGLGAGAVYVFNRTGTIWTQAQKILPPGAFEHTNANFGELARLRGDRFIVNAPRTSYGGFNQAGAAYVFRRSGENWLYEGRLLSDTPENQEWFGFDVEIDNDLAMVGGFRKTVLGQSNAGSAYVFRRFGEKWLLAGRLRASTPEPFTFFGYGIGLADSLALVSSIQQSVGPVPTAGAVRAFDTRQIDGNFDSIPDQCQIAAGTLTDSDSNGIPDLVQFDPCPANFNGAGGVEVLDLFDFVNIWLIASPRADFNRSGTVTIQDLFEFINAWFAGC